MTTTSKSLLNGLPIKKSRIHVFEILNQNPQGLSADNIYAQIKNEYKINNNVNYYIYFGCISDAITNNQMLTM